MTHGDGAKPPREENPHAAGALQWPRSHCLGLSHRLHQRVARLADEGS